MYVKSVPEDNYGERGKTYVYKVERGNDTLLCQFDWYSSNIYLVDDQSPYAILVRLGSWPWQVGPVGSGPSNNDLAVAFYKDASEVKKYSMLDILKLGYTDASAVQKSVSHYQMFKAIGGLRRTGRVKWVFDMETYEGAILSFDVATGELRTKYNKEHEKLIRYIEFLKGRYANRFFGDNVEKRRTYKITEEELRKTVEDRFPAIPEGYKLYIGTEEEPPRLEPIKKY
jgi:hypothetical protein